jgi:O-methyltransferase
MILPCWVDLSSWASAADSARRHRLFRQVRAYTLASRQHLNTLLELGRRIETDRVAGAIVECGVYRGGSAAILAAATDPSREIYLFDSFAGLPPPGDKDGSLASQQYRDGWCAATPEDVEEIFERLAIPRSRAHIVKGWFAETLPTTALPQIALLHVDADWYDPVRLCLEVLYPRVAPGGFIVLDDYGRWEGCTRAADEFLRANGLGTPLDPRSPTGHFFQKPGRPSSAP